MSRGISYYLFLSGAVLSLLLPALINGYPLVYADTATYLDSGFTFGMPFDRPMTYGLFLRFVSLNGLSLWMVIAVPSLLMAWLIFRLYTFWLEGKELASFFAFLTVLLLSLFTGLSWTASQLMPDIFTPIMFLSALLLLTGTCKRSESILLYFLFFLSAAMHLSHLSFNMAFFVSILIIREIKPLGLKSHIRTRPLLVLLLLSMLAGLSGASSYAKSKHIFLMGAMVEHGIVQPYLDEHCGSKDYRLCEYKDSLPDLAWQFLWDPDSPLEKLGGWKETKEEFNEIIRATLRSPKYLALHLRESVKATAHQLVKFKLGDGNGIFLEGSQLHERMNRYMPGEISAYETSLQNRGKLNIPTWIHRMQQGFIVLSFLLLIGLLFGKRKAYTDSKYLGLVILILLAVIIHAWICGTFANAIDRLGTKMIWLLVLPTALGSVRMKKLY